MADDTTIAILVEVARSAGHDIPETKRARLDDLIAKGLVALSDDQRGPITRYRPTPAGQALLDERGVGANES